MVPERPVSEVNDADVSQKLRGAARWHPDDSLPAAGIRDAGEAKATGKPIEL